MDNHIEEVQIEKKDKGFTLVELLIVIVILGILATVTVFAVRGITDQGQDSACAADQKTLEVAVEAFFAQNGTDIALTEAALVPGFIRSESTTFDVEADGDVVVAPNRTDDSSTANVNEAFTNKCAA
jgi:prepilin-type N-terminal cleavage/methylation domain-containing protein